MTARRALRRQRLTAHDALRAKDTPAETLGLLKPGASDETLIAAMVADPILVNRPFVRTPTGAVLARPSERVFSVLDRAPQSFTKEDGQVVTNP